MSNVRNFIAEHSDNPELEDELKKIESMDISNIKKLDLIQAAKEEAHVPFIVKKKRGSSEDSILDEMRRETERY